QVTLRAGAELNARRVHQYALTLWAACPGENEVEEWLFVYVTVGQALRCDTPFASTRGDTVRVSADVAPRTPLYAVLPQPLSRLMVSGGCSQTLAFRLQNHDTPLILTRRGLVLAPASGFDLTKDTQEFRLEIEVMDHHGHNCSGVVTVEVLPSRRPRVTFPKSQQALTVPMGIGPLDVVTQVQATGDNIRYTILAPLAPALFTINERTGLIRSTRRLEGAHAGILVRAYNALHPDDQDNTALNITVQGTDHRAPSCVPAIFVSQVPETVSPGSTLVALRCTQPLGTKGDVHYALEGPPTSCSHFRMDGPQLQVNTTLNYDSEAMAALGFQFTATIVVTVGGQHLQTSRVPVLVTVTPVNEFTPSCPSGATFTVLETAAFGSAVGRVAGTDHDFPPDSLEYSLEGGPGPTQPFSIDTHTGEIRVVGPLDSQQHKSYRLTVQLTDTHNDLDPVKRRSCLCEVTVRLQAVSDKAPVCSPEVQELRITAVWGGRQLITRLLCQGSPDGTVLAYSITEGNEDGRFWLEGNTVFYLPDNLIEPRTFVLLVEVWKGGPSAFRHSTVVALVVHITPRSTLLPPSTMTPQTTLHREPLVVTRTEAVWHPPAWFVAVLTLSGALLLATLGYMAWRSLHRIKAASSCVTALASDLLYPQSLVRAVGGSHGTLPISFLSDLPSTQGQFDGRAQDTRTGRDYLFNSVTGARRWM
ncbi:CDHR4 protein, partial [Rhinopomastus cyanomelas]|nr:CDHR4 protein [Rhinopomastus cyanomelas]